MMKEKNKKDIKLSKLMKWVTNEKFKTNSLSQKQYLKNLKMINNISQEEIGTRSINTITANELEKYFDSLIYYSNSYIQKYFSYFSEIFDYAHTKGYIQENTMSHIRKPVVSKFRRHIRTLNLYEQEPLTNYLKSSTLKHEPYKNVFLIQLYCGLRTSEVLALQTTDIDLESNLLHVTKTLSTNFEGKPIITPLRTSRTVPIPGIILNELKKQLAVAQNNFNGQLFLTSNGKYIAPQNMNYTLKKILLEKFSITGITTQSLRNTFLVRCIEEHISPTTIQKMMGYGNIDIVLNHYTSTFNDFLDTNPYLNIISKEIKVSDIER